VLADIRQRRLALDGHPVPSVTEPAFTDRFAEPPQATGGRSSTTHH